METKNLEIYNQLKSVPETAQSTIQGGRLKGMTDIKPIWRIQRLTEIFGACGFGWYTNIKNYRFENGADGEICCFVEIELFVKIGNEWSQGIIGVGGSSFVSKEKDGKYTSDECLKMAYTDAISVACKSLGMGADIYWGDKGTKYSTQKDDNDFKLKKLETIEIKYGKYAGKKFKDLTPEERLELRADKNEFIRNKMIEYDDLLNPDLQPIDFDAIEIPEENNLEI